MTSAPPPQTSASLPRNPGESEKILTAPEVAKILRVGTYRVIDFCRTGELVAYKPGRTWLIYRSDVDAYIRSHPNTDKAAS
jgi:excisionase family DNA binding protein